MNRRIVIAVVLLLAAFAAVWWMLRGGDARPVTSTPDTVPAADDDARSETPRAGRRERDAEGPRRQSPATPPQGRPCTAASTSPSIPTNPRRRRWI